MMKISGFIWILLFSLAVNAQEITGSVKDSSGNSLAFASIFIKGSNKGTSANNEGRFTLHIEKGNYTIVCQHVGYKKVEKQVTVGEGTTKLDFELAVQGTTLAEVIVKNGEDPAYAIIRNAIAKRSFYYRQTEKYKTRVYTKGQMRTRDFPKKFMGQKIDFEDGDTSKKKIIYLSETLSDFTVDKDQQKIEVISSKVSGQSDGFGLAAPNIISFYRENISFGRSLNPRGFISPISGNALNYYRYKLEGTYFEDGRMVNHILVTPKRKYEPLFSGYMDIVDQDWRIHSLNLQLTKTASMELLDTLRIEQLYRPVTNDTWFLSTQVIYPAIKMFGFDGYGSFLNVYTDVELPVSFQKKTFTHTIIKYLDSANKRSDEYWQVNRPVPLMNDETRDYVKKDSLEKARKDPRYLDSLDRIRNKTSFVSLLTVGKSFSFSKTRSEVSLPAILEEVFFNPAEGLVLSPTITWSKRLDSTISSRRSISIASNLRYGFSNHHFNSFVSVNYRYGKKYATLLSLSGGSRVFQFNNNSPIGERGNTISCLFGEKNRIKSYEARFLRGSIRKTFGEGIVLTGGFQFQDRQALDNTTDFTLRDRKSRAYTPNYPFEIMATNLVHHQAFNVQAMIRWQPGVRYIELPDRKSSLGSKYPVFTLQYVQGIPNILGSDLKYSKWKFAISDHFNFRLYGRFRYRIGIGGFLNTDSVQVPDYDHFNGNTSTLASAYLNSFQLLPIYQFSNTARFYALAHLEHNFNGFLTNKIPGIRRLNLYLVTGLNGFYINSNRYYYEIFAGLDNILKQVRVDFVQSFLNGRPWQNSIRIGLPKFNRGRGEE